jgi:hypothetical protein
MSRTRPSTHTSKVRACLPAFNTNTNVLALLLPLLALLSGTRFPAAAPPPATALHAWADLPMFLRQVEEGGPARQRWTPFLESQA